MAGFRCILTILISSFWKTLGLPCRTRIRSRSLWVSSRLLVSSQQQHGIRHFRSPPVGCILKCSERFDVLCQHYKQREKIHFWPHCRHYWKIYGQCQRQDNRESKSKESLFFGYRQDSRTVDTIYEEDGENKQMEVNSIIFFKQLINYWLLGKAGKPD